MLTTTTATVAQLGSSGALDGGRCCSYHTHGPPPSVCVHINYLCPNCANYRGQFVKTDRNPRVVALLSTSFCTSFERRRRLSAPPSAIPTNLATVDKDFSEELATHPPRENKDNHSQRWQNDQMLGHQQPVRGCWPIQGRPNPLVAHRHHPQHHLFSQQPRYPRQSPLADIRARGVVNCNPHRGKNHATPLPRAGAPRFPPLANTSAAMHNYGQQQQQQQQQQQTSSSCSSHVLATRQDDKGGVPIPQWTRTLSSSVEWRNRTTPTPVCQWDTDYPSSSISGAGSSRKQQRHLIDGSDDALSLTAVEQSTNVESHYKNLRVSVVEEKATGLYSVPSQLATSQTERSAESSTISGLHVEKLQLGEAVDPDIRMLFGEGKKETRSSFVPSFDSTENQHQSSVARDTPSAHSAHVHFADTADEEIPGGDLLHPCPNAFEMAMLVRGLGGTSHEGSGNSPSALQMTSSTMSPRRALLHAQGLPSAEAELLRPRPSSFEMGLLARGMSAISGYRGAVQSTLPSDTLSRSAGTSLNRAQFDREARDEVSSLALSNLSTNSQGSELESHTGALSSPAPSPERHSTNNLYLSREISFEESTTVASADSAMPTAPTGKQSVMKKVPSKLPPPLKVKAEQPKSLSGAEGVARTASVQSVGSVERSSGESSREEQPTAPTGKEGSERSEE